MSVLLYRLGRFCHRSRRLVVLAWAGALLVLGLAATALASPSVTSFSLPGTESQQAMDLLSDRFAGTPLDGGTAKVVFEAKDGGVAGAAPRAEVETVLADLAAAPQVAGVTDPFADDGMLSEDGSTAVAEVTFEVPFAEIDQGSRQAILDIVEQGETSTLRIEVGGDAMEPLPEVGSELVGLAVAAAVLLVTFWSLLAAGMPLATGITGVTAGVLGITAATGFIDLGATTPILALMLGLAVGIDYALFIVSRFRDELRLGIEPGEAAGRATGTAGAAVVFAGLTVVIALAGLSLVGVGLLTEMGIAAAATVAVTVLVALTLVPALLGFAGRKVLPRRERTAGAAMTGREERHAVAGRWVGAVTRHPLVALVLAVGGIGLLALPATDLRLGLPDQGTYPEQTTQRQAYDAIAQQFGPGFNGPLLVVVDLADAEDRTSALAAVRTEVAAADGVVAISPPQRDSTGDTAILGVVPEGGPDSPGTERLVEDIRSSVRSAAVQEGAEVAVTGTTALIIDFNHKMGSALWAYLLVVVGISFLLLTALFRSIVVPLKATVGFLLSVAATFGVLVAVFQWGWLAPLGITASGAVVSMLPIFIVGVVFGLAMDYEVFLVTRMSEAHVHGATPLDAVRTGFRHGAGVVTAAALIMISVFGGFVLGEATDIIQIGVALAAAVAVDAFVVRMTIVPAVLALVGERAWWLPRWLERLLPPLGVEAERLHRSRDEERPRRTVG